MQYSKSFAHFAPSEQQRQVSTHTRAQRRSSLDTFVIPGRTRLPSSKASIFDLQVAQGLLNSDPPRPPEADMTSAESVESSPDTSPARCMPRRGPTSSSSGPLHYRTRPDIMKRPPPRFGGHEVINVPPQRLRPDLHQRAHKASVPISSQKHTNVQTFDGADGSVTESRLTSTTWSTISHRVFSGSSSSSRTMDASYYRDEYNKLAGKYALPRLEAALDGDLDENNSQTKTTTKTHHPGWLARKLFRRSTSTYTLKAKATYKPISKKKSFSGIPILSEDSHKNILKGKSLEEVGRLGGLSVLTLPLGYAVDKLTLPTCLSATATYLCSHGCNAPGLFRVSGQNTIVNALYDFYDHQFASADAGSPSKVELTVGSGLLPSHIEHTIHDVASFFKRVVIELPGGLLGSVDLFEALCSVTTNFEHDAELSDSDLASLKAKMIALAISSVASDYRFYLIQAVLGLASYFGHEAERLQAESDTSDEGQASAELMNYKTLGVVLGPLLLGNLTDRALHGSSEGRNGGPCKPLEVDSAKKFRKHRHKHSDVKLDQSATISAHVNQANHTAVAMQQLLSLWPNVVKQLLDINGTANSSLKSKSRRHLKKMPSHTSSRLTLKTSEEEVKFFDILRGRTLPEEIRGAVRIKGNIQMKSRSPMSQGAIDPSEDENSYDIRLSPANDESGTSGPGHTQVSERAAQDNELADNSEPQSGEGSAEVSMMPLITDTRLVVESRTNSDLAMEKMAMGTILPPLQLKSRPSSRNEFLRLIDPTTETPRKTRTSSSQSKTPETALRDARPAEHSRESEESQLQISMRKPLPPIGDAQRAESFSLAFGDTIPDSPSRLFTKNERSDSPHPKTSSNKSSRSSFSSRTGRQSAEETTFRSRQSGQWPSSPTKKFDEKTTFPPRQSSLPMEQHLALKPLETYSTIAEYKAKADTYMSPPKFNIPREASEAQIEQNKAPNDSLRPSNVRTLAQRFTDASRAMRRNNQQATETAIPKIYAFVESLPLPKSPMLGLDDPFSSAESNNVSKESLIPKPVRDVGRTRESRSLSPPKRPPPKAPAPKRQSTFGVVADRDAEIVQNNTVPKPPISQENNGEEAYDEVVTISNGHHQRSAESLHRRNTRLEESSPGSHRVHKRSTSFAELARPISNSHPNSPSFNTAVANLESSAHRSNSYLNASDALKSLERHTSINATMYSEICRLQRVLQQRGEEIEAKDRRIEALEEVQGGNPMPNAITSKRSFGIGGSYDELRQTRSELSMWRMRAESAEKKLSELEKLPFRSVKSGTVEPEYTDPTERAELIQRQDGEEEMGGVLNVQRISPDSRKRRALVREGHLPPSTPPRGKGLQSEVVYTTPSPRTARVHIAVERERGEKEEGILDWRGRNDPGSNIGDRSWSSGEKAMVEGERKR